MQIDSTEKVAKAGNRGPHIGFDRDKSDLSEATRLLQQGRFAESETCSRAALALQPDDVDVLNLLGVAVWRQGRAAEAEAIYRRACQIKPNDLRILTNLGLILYDQDRIVEAAECYRRVIQIQPAAFDATMNLGLVLSDQGKFEEAMDWLNRAYRFRPYSPHLLLILGMNLVRQGRIDEAIKVYERAVSLQPDFPRLRRNFAHALLSRGDYERGWQEYEWRIQCDDHRDRRINGPIWNGDDFPGGTILLHAEQGLGDTLQFIRFAPLVKARGGFVVVFCQTRLLGLVARCNGVDLAFDGSSFEPNCTIHAPLMSLPAILGTTLDNLPAQVPYLATDPVLVEHWRAELDRAIEMDRDLCMEAPERSGAGRRMRPFLVGIAWQGSPTHRRDSWRSFALSQFAPMAELPGVRLISLQIDHGLDQLAGLPGRLPITDLTGRRGRDFTETAAIMTHLDLVITPDTAVAHLAGGLGVPVWVALSSVGEWRWQVGRDDSPWYPTMRLFRQTALGDWDGVFRRMTEALKSAVSSRQ